MKRLMLALTLLVGFTTVVWADEPEKRGGDNPPDKPGGGEGEGGTGVGAVTNAGAGVLSTNGGSIELTKPTLDATKGKAFYKVAAGVSAP